MSIFVTTLSHSRFFLTSIFNLNIELSAYNVAAAASLTNCAKLRDLVFLYHGYFRTCYPNARWDTLPRFKVKANVTMLSKILFQLEIDNFNRRKLAYVQAVRSHKYHPTCFRHKKNLDLVIDFLERFRKFMILDGDSLI